MDAEVAAVSIIMQTDPSQLSVWTQRQQAFFMAEVSSQDEAANPVLKHALDTFKVANAHSNQRTLGIEPGKRWVLDRDLPAGDCILKAGSYIDVDPVAGRGQFSVTAYTTHTTSTDVWHQRWQVLDGNNSVVATFGGAGIVDVGDLKDDHIPKSNSGVVVWPPNAFTSGQAALVSWQGAC